mmetsp:Transcript_81078/g.211313  ORF Transcript_81078/g.211313 Transcript_81078/m.211313 type:complete len:242 (-) Transcript_81078:9-734(-)
MHVAPADALAGQLRHFWAAAALQWVHLHICPRVTLPTPWCSLQLQGRAGSLGHLRYLLLWRGAMRLGAARAFGDLTDQGGGGLARLHDEHLQHRRDAVDGPKDHGAACRRGRRDGLIGASADALQELALHLAVAVDGRDDGPDLGVAVRNVDNDDHGRNLLPMRKVGHPRQQGQVNLQQRTSARSGDVPRQAMAAVREERLQLAGPPSLRELLGLRNFHAQCHGHCRRGVRARRGCGLTKR